MTAADGVCPRFNLNPTNHIDYRVDLVLFARENERDLFEFNCSHYHPSSSQKQM